MTWGGGGGLAQAYPINSVADGLEPTDCVLAKSFEHHVRTQNNLANDTNTDHVKDAHTCSNGRDENMRE